MTQRKWLHAVALSLIAAGLMWAGPAFGQAVVVYSENFDGLDLGPVDDEARPPDPVLNAWSATGPEGWTVDNSQLPAGGVAEWSGWTYANPLFWAGIGGDGREAFSFGTGDVIAVADSDEWDDKAHDPGTYNTFLKSPVIPLSGLSANELALSFDSSWRAEGNQTAILQASYDGGAPVEVFRWESDPVSPNYKPDANPSSESYQLNHPAGVSSVQLTFGYTQAANNWWWAVDNVGLADSSDFVVFEDFETVDLGPPTDEAVFTGDPDKLWTETGPAGWVIDESKVPGIGDDATDGVTEWAGWSFADKNWWIQTAGDQERSAFDKGQNVVAIADPDEWDDNAHPKDGVNWYQTALTTSEIDISNLKEGTAKLKFDNTWRPEYDGDWHQAAKVSVSFDGGAPVELFQWLSSDVNGDDTTDEVVDGQTTTLGHRDLINSAEEWSIPNPEGAQKLTVTWEMFDAGNDWWWAIDNIEVSGEEKGSVVFACGDFDKDADVDSADLLGFLGAWTGAGGTGGTFDTGDCDEDADVDSADLLTFLANWTGDLGGGVAPPGFVGPAPPAARGEVASVPEPGSVVLVLMGLAMACCGRRRSA